MHATTLTLDPDVAALIEEARRAKGLSLRDVVNDALRQGLTATESRSADPFRTRAVDLGHPRLPQVGDVADALEQLEDDLRP